MTTFFANFFFCPATSGLFVSDYACYLKINGTYSKQILAFEIKRDILLRNLVKLTDNHGLKRQEFNSYLNNIIGQIYNYMSLLQLFFQAMIITSFCIN